MKNCVKQLRRNLDISQEALAKVIGVSRQTIACIEGFKHEPSISIALKIADFFGKDPREIFFADDVNYVQQKQSTA